MTPTERRARLNTEDHSADAALAAERAYAGALVLASNDLARDATSIAPPDTVADPWCRTVVTAAAQMLDAGLPRDQVTVADWIDRHHAVDTGFRASRLWSSVHELTADCPVPVNVRWYAGIVADHARRRRAAAMADTLTVRITRGDAAEVDAILAALSYAVGGAL